MQNVGMTIRTFDLVIRHMVLVHELRGIFGFQYFGYFMTLETFSLGDVPIPSYHIDMTLFAGHSSHNIFPVIEAPALNLDISFRFDMTGGAASDSTGDTLFLSRLASPIKVTNKTIGLMNGKMGSLNKLSMTGGTSKPHSPS